MKCGRKVEPNLIHDRFLCQEKPQRAMGGKPRAENIRYGVLVPAGSAISDTLFYFLQAELYEPFSDTRSSQVLRRDYANGNSRTMEIILKRFNFVLAEIIERASELLTGIEKSLVLVKR